MWGWVCGCIKEVCMEVNMFLKRFPFLTFSLVKGILQDLLTRRVKISNFDIIVIHIEIQIYPAKDSAERGLVFLKKLKI